MQAPPRFRVTSAYYHYIIIFCRKQTIVNSQSESIEKSGYLSILINIHIICRRIFRKSGHRHHISVSTTTNPAPLRCQPHALSVKPLGLPRSFRLSDSEYWVLAIQTGSLSKPSSLSLAISFSALAEYATPSAPYISRAIMLIFPLSAIFRHTATRNYSHRFSHSRL